MTDITEPMPHIQNFSDGYYLIDGLFVEPNDRISAPKIQDYLYAEIQDEYYGEQAVPILFRHNGANYHFRIEPAEGVQSNTVEMPFSVVNELDLQPVPSEEQFLLTKPGHARTIIDMSSPDIGMSSG